MSEGCFNQETIVSRENATGRGGVNALSLAFGQEHVKDLYLACF